MPRTDNDTWDLASSVGATATMVAAARAVATRSEHALIDDPFAEPLVRAVGVDFFTQLATGELTPADLDDDPAMGLDRLSDNMAVRTRFFDEFFLDATSAGIRQAVILAAGLDARAYRLQWPAGTTVFEVDQPAVIEFKTATLAKLGATPTADRRPVAVDLRHDWPSALRAAGFDATTPTAWIAEGLLGYLPPAAQDQLLDHITALSAPGSRVASESIPDAGRFDREDVKARMASVTDRWRSHGFDLDMTDLVYLEDRNEPAAYLTAHGWAMTARSLRELFAEHGLPPFQEADTPFADMEYINGTLAK